MGQAAATGRNSIFRKQDGTARGAGRGDGRPVTPGEQLRGRHPLQLTLVLGGLIALGPLSIDMYLPALPAMQAELGASDAAVQLTISGVLLGMAVGQLLVGSLSDALGRRRPLLAGLLLYSGASMLCVVAPSAALLGVLRVFQGLGAAAAAVIATAIVRDLLTGTALARLLSRLLLLPLAAPVFAPSLGSAVLRRTQWEGIFVILAALGILLIFLTAVRVGETLPPQRRRPARVGVMLRPYRVLMQDGPFMGLVLVAGLAMAALIAYVAGASFVFQEEYGMSEQQFALTFGIGGLSLIAASQLNARLLHRYPPERVLRNALITGTTAGLVLVAMSISGLGGPADALVPLWLMVGTIGVIFPNAPALAMSRHGQSAGTAAALLGAVQFGLGGLAAPIVGVLGSGMLAMASVSTMAMLAATGVMLSITRRIGVVSAGAG